MKAMVYTRYGPPEVLHAAEVPTPVPRRDEVLIRVRATTVAAADVRCRAFRVPPAFWIPARLALGVFSPRRRILGGELAGDIVAVGEGVTRFRPGDQVFGETLMRPGGYAEYACLAESGVLARKPVRMSYEEAAAVPIGARAALHYLRRARVTRGQRVLVYGASGSVGTFAVQLARHAGAHVTAMCSGANLDLVRSLGADEALDYRVESVGGRRGAYDVVFVAVDRCRFSDGLKALTPCGTYLNVTTPLRTPHMRWAAWTGDRTIIVGEMAKDGAADLDELRGLVDAGALRAVIDRRYPLVGLVEAHRYVDQGHKAGAVVITVP